MIRVVHPGSGSLLFSHPDSRIQGSKRHRIPDPQHWKKYIKMENRFHIPVLIRKGVHSSDQQETEQRATHQIEVL